MHMDDNKVTENRRTTKKHTGTSRGYTWTVTKLPEMEERTNLGEYGD